MTYTTQADLEDRYGTQMLIQLTDRGATYTGVIDTDVVARALADTDALINGYVGPRYVLPFASVPDPIPALARVIAIYLLHVIEAPQKITRDYEMAMRTLEKIAAGAVQLSAAGVAPEATDAGGAQIADRDQAMTIENLKGFI